MNPNDAPDTSPDARQWLPVAAAAARLGVSTKTLRKRLAGGQLRFRRVALARGGMAYEVEVEGSISAFVPTSTPPNKPNGGRRVFTLEKGEVEGSISPSKPTPKSSISPSKPAGEVELLRDALTREREQVTFLRGLVEQRDRSEAELRAALREALKLAPKQLAAPSPLGGELEQVGTLKKGALDAPESAQNGEAGSYGPKASDGPKTGVEREETGLSYGDIADALEKEMNR
jgi:hypothetical protein